MKALSRFTFPWINAKFLGLVKKRNNAFRRAKRSGTSQAWASYRCHRNHTLSYLRLLKSKFFKSLSSTSDSRTFWSYVNKLKKKPANVIPSLCSDNSLLHSPQEKSTLLNATFASHFNSSSSPLQTIPPNQPFCRPPDLFCSPMSIKNLIYSISGNPSPGEDQISLKMLKATFSSVSLPLTIIFNSSINVNIFPADFKNSLIIPIPKTSPPSPVPSKYRPISLLSIPSKLLERLVFNYLLDICLSNNLISDSQFGFLPQRSTESALLSALTPIYSALDDSSSVCCVFFDLSKAFDSVPHRPLLNKLSSLPIPSSLISWLHSYLCNRSQQVVVDSTFSSKCNVLSGVPQGSILGPLLFILYINDLTLIDLPSSATLTLYADDILLTLTLSNTSPTSLVQTSIDSISTWISSNFLSLNITKTQYMLISRKSPKLPPLPLHVNHQPISSTSSYKYLGILISSSLSWSPHINSICKKVRKLSAVIFRSFYPHASPSTLLKLYKSLIFPHFTYCSSLWDPPPGSVDAALLERTQRFALRVCSRDWKAGSDILLTRLSLFPLSTHRSISKLIFLYKIIHNLIHLPNLFKLFKFKGPPNYSIRSFDHLTFNPPFCKTHATAVSFLPSVIKLWNSLPICIRSSQSLSNFKVDLFQFFSTSSH